MLENIFMGLSLFPIVISLWTSFTVYQGRNFWMEFTLEKDESQDEDQGLQEDPNIEATV